MIDLHCHILPGVDDGPSDLEGALAMARVAAADGIHRLAATPHVPYSGLERQQIVERVAVFQDEIDRAGIDLRLYVGADAATSVGVAALAAHPLHDGPYQLIEFPHTHLPADAGELVFELLNCGRVPIITHPERNPSVLRSPDLIGELVAAGALVQITAESLTGGFGPESRACGRHLLRNGWVHLLASDGHSADWRPPVLSKGLKAAGRVIGKAAALKLVVDNPAKILAGEGL
ncbi:tyrosine-protein phosphatase [Geothermobacter hydrogeniphilus]|nr:CpsB/CapC family capsule biosynthesis tyrosine phosphatase [Geothermobacter hydrogeniphilus]